jgi:hypothetical protein
MDYRTLSPGTVVIMKYKIKAFYLWVFALLAVNLAYARADAPRTTTKSDSIKLGKSDFLGSATCKEENYDHLTIVGSADMTRVGITRDLRVIGPLQFNTLQVGDKISVIGPMEGEDGKFNIVHVTGLLVAKKFQAQELHVTGPVELSEGHILGSIKIVGSLSAESSQFQDIEITTEQASFNNCSLNNLTVRKNDESKPSPQIIFLDGQTEVKGIITFEQAGGVVQLKSANVNIGEVVNGQVQKKF